MISGYLCQNIFTYWCRRVRTGNQCISWRNSVWEDCALERENNSFKFTDPSAVNSERLIVSRTRYEMHFSPLAVFIFPGWLGFFQWKAQVSLEPLALCSQQVKHQAMLHPPSVACGNDPMYSALGLRSQTTFASVAKKTQSDQVFLAAYYFLLINFVKHELQRWKRTKEKHRMQWSQNKEHIKSNTQQRMSVKVRAYRS